MVKPTRAAHSARATELVERAAHPWGAAIRKQFQEDVGHVLDQIELAEENRRVNRAKGSTKPKDVRGHFAACCSGPRSLHGSSRARCS